MTSQGIYLHNSNPIVLKIPCAKFHASSCSQTNAKVGGTGLHPHPETRFRKPTRNRVKKREVKFNIIINGEKVRVNAPPALIAWIFSVSLKDKFAVRKNTNNKSKTLLQ